MIDKNFNKARDEFVNLCNKYKVSVPLIIKSYNYDPCDVTDINMVRLNISAAIEGGIDFDIDESFEYYINHVFVHYLCELNNSNESDYVVDLILNWKNKNESKCHCR